MYLNGFKKNNLKFTVIQKENGLWRQAPRAVNVIIYISIIHLKRVSQRRLTVWSHLGCQELFLINCNKITERGSDLLDARKTTACKKTSLLIFYHSWQYQIHQSLPLFPLPWDLLQSFLQISASHGIQFTMNKHLEGIIFYVIQWVKFQHLVHVAPLCCTMVPSSIL